MSSILNHFYCFFGEMLKIGTEAGI